MGGALEGTVVLDLTEGVAGPFCTKLLAGYGAEVLKCERPGAGDPARRQGPFAAGEADGETGALHLYLNTGKKSVELDVRSAEGAEAVRELARQADLLVVDDAAGLAAAGLSWEFLRPFAGDHSILVLDGEEHLRERRLIQTPFHGERMRALQPLVAELARAELAGWRGRVVTLDRMKRLTLETILRVVFGVRGEEEAAVLREAVHGTLDTVRSLPRMLAMSLVQRDLGPWSPWGRFRLAVVTNCDDDLFAASSRRLGDPFEVVVTAEQARSYKPAPRHLELLLERLRLPPERVVIVAQSLYHDHVPAKASGIRTVWVDRRRGAAGSGATPPASVEPDLVVPDIATLADVAVGAPPAA